MYPVLKQRIPVNREEDLLGLVEALGKQPLDGSWDPDGAIVVSLLVSLKILSATYDKFCYSQNNT